MMMLYLVFTMVLFLVCFFTPISYNFIESCRVDNYVERVMNSGVISVLWPLFLVMILIIVLLAGFSRGLGWIDRKVFGRVK